MTLYPNLINPPPTILNGAQTILASATVQGLGILLPTQAYYPFFDPRLLGSVPAFRLETDTRKGTRIAAYGTTGQGVLRAIFYLPLSMDIGTIETAAENLIDDLITLGLDQTNSFLNIIDVDVTGAVLASIAETAGGESGQPFQGGAQCNIFVALVTWEG